MNVFPTLGYVIIRVQVEGLKSYNKIQVALFVLDSTAFGSRDQVTLGTPTINQIMNVIKEIEIDEVDWGYPTYWLDIEQNFPLRMTQLPVQSTVWLSWMRLWKQQNESK